MSAAQHTPGRLLIEVVPSKRFEGLFDVLLNGFSYAIHRSLTLDRASNRADECFTAATNQGQRAAIAKATGSTS